MLQWFRVAFRPPGPARSPLASVSKRMTFPQCLQFLRRSRMPVSFFLSVCMERVCCLPYTSYSWFCFVTATFHTMLRQSCGPLMRRRWCWSTKEDTSLPRSQCPRDLCLPAPPNQPTSPSRTLHWLLAACSLHCRLCSGRWFCPISFRGRWLRKGAAN